jgi:hypothetical protein
MASATAAIVANGNALIAGHAFDVVMEQIAGSRILIADYRQSRMQIVPTAELSVLQDADEGRDAKGGLGRLSRGPMPTA